MKSSSARRKFREACLLLVLGSALAPGVALAAASRLAGMPRELSAIACKQSVAGLGEGVALPVFRPQRLTRREGELELRPLAVDEHAAVMASFRRGDAEGDVRAMRELLSRQIPADSPLVPGGVVNLGLFENGVLVGVAQLAATEARFVRTSHWVQSRQNWAELQLRVFPAVRRRHLGRRFVELARYVAYRGLRLDGLYAYVPATDEAAERFLRGTAFLPSTNRPSADPLWNFPLWHFIDTAVRWRRGQAPPETAEARNRRLIASVGNVLFPEAVRVELIDIRHRELPFEQRERLVDRLMRERTSVAALLTAVELAYVVELLAREDAAVGDLVDAVVLFGPMRQEHDRIMSLIDAARASGGALEELLWADPFLTLRRLNDYEYGELQEQLLAPENRGVSGEVVVARFLSDRV